MNTINVQKLPGSNTYGSKWRVVVDGHTTQVQRTHANGYTPYSGNRPDQLAVEYIQVQERLNDIYQQLLDLGYQVNEVPWSPEEVDLVVQDIIRHLQKIQPDMVIREDRIRDALNRLLWSINLEDVDTEFFARTWKG